MPRRIIDTRRGRHDVRTANFPAGNMDARGRWQESERRQALSMGGVFNAANRKQAGDYTARMASQIAAGEWEPQNRFSASNGLADDNPRGQSRTASADELRALHATVRSAVHDDSTHTRLAQDVQIFLKETGDRVGFMPLVLVEKEMNPGAPYKIPIGFKQGTVQVAEGPTHVVPATYRNKTITPPEFDIQAHIKGGIPEIAANPGNALNDMLNQGLEQIVVASDRLVRNFSQNVANVFHAPIGISTLTPTIASQAEVAVTEFSASPAQTMIMAVSFWTDFRTDSAWAEAYSPVQQYELLLDGRMGSVYGMTLVTDGMRIEQLQVLEPDEVFVYAAPDKNGAFIKYSEVESTPTDYRSLSQNAIGFFISQRAGVVYHGARSTISIQRT